MAAGKAKPQRPAHLSSASIEKRKPMDHDSRSATLLLLFALQLPSAGSAEKSSSLEGTDAQLPVTVTFVTTIVAVRKRLWSGEVQDVLPRRGLSHRKSMCSGAEVDSGCS